ncbi:unnamed protein product [Psylliodes chrysocephalus]|uniref:Lysosome-associated membrane glycoprotein 5 n=1 Tax=Psylliodes chrysocephalus TaxID=3402493 RepID=A0A9P0C8C6_9CUCU|nr:unnamed protein product [Psylliodes chrysocephala]
MGNLKLLLVLSIFVAAVISDERIEPEPFPPSINPNNSTTHPNTTVTSPPSSTHKPNTTTTSSTTTTTTSTTAAPPSPNTTTTSTTVAPPSPNTTTTSTTTTLPPSPNTTTTSTTTALPPSPNTTTTTSAPPITTTEPPKPVPEPQTGNWSVHFDKNVNKSCMIVDAAVQFEFLLANATKKINLPVGAIADGSCDEKRDAINLKWDKNVFSLTFDKRNDSKFELESIEAKFFNLSLLNGAKNYSLVHNTPEFGTPLGNSYKCAKVQTFNLTEKDDNKTVAYLHISHVQMQAFANNTGHKFDTAVDCEASPITSDVVPIVVGCVLAALVIMIMVAYLVARRRCQARGYLSIDTQPDD